MDKLHIDNISDSFDKEDYIEKSINNKTLNLEFYYLSCFKNTKMLRDFINIICSKFNIPEKEVARFTLITDEMNNNAIEYGSLDEEMNIIRVIVENRDENIHFIIEVQDTGNWAKHKTAKEMEKLRNEKLEKWFKWYTSIRWRGLFLIITNIVDKLYFKDTENWGLIVWIEKKIMIEDKINT